MQTVLSDGGGDGRMGHEVVDLHQDVFESDEAKLLFLGGLGVVSATRRRAVSA